MSDPPKSDHVMVNRVPKSHIQRHFRPLDSHPVMVHSVPKSNIWRRVRPPKSHPLIVNSVPKSSIWRHSRPPRGPVIASWHGDQLPIAGGNVPCLESPLGRVRLGTRRALATRVLGPLYSKILTQPAQPSHRDMTPSGVISDPRNRVL
jgi:hypothetical protein